MNKLFFIGGLATAALCMNFGPLSAQEHNNGAPALPAMFRRQPTPNDTLQSVRKVGEGSYIFSIYAPKAMNVSVSGDMINWAGPRPKAVKEDNGVWKIRVEGIVTPGVFRYNFVVDGNKVLDPKSPLSAETSNLLLNVSDKDFLAEKNVPHGAIAQRIYYSRTLGCERRLHVWTPAGYEKGKDKLPVLYLIHGGGDNDLSWPTVGRAGQILDNLMAEGKMKPMVVVMPNGTIETEDLNGEVPIFIEDLMTDIVPFIDANYNVEAKPQARALAGLSMGGLETMETLLKYYEDFDYFWVLSSGWFANQPEIYAQKAKVLKEIGPAVNKTVKQLVFTQGGPADIAYNNCKAMLKLWDDAGIKYTYDESHPFGHTWQTWTWNLYDLAQQLFK